MARHCMAGNVRLKEKNCGGNLLNSEKPPQKTETGRCDKYQTREKVRGNPPKHFAFMLGCPDYEKSGSEGRFFGSVFTSGTGRRESLYYTRRIKCKLFSKKRMIFDKNALYTRKNALTMRKMRVIFKSRLSGDSLALRSRFFVLRK